MSMPPSQTRICNAALALLGETAWITTINDGTPIANQFKTHWDDARRSALADHPWNFALHRQSLPASADHNAVGAQYERAFELPADCLRWLPWAKGHPDYFVGELEGDYILSNADAPVTARFIRDVDDVSKWSPGFVSCMAAKLAFLTAKPITGQKSTQDRMGDIYDDALRTAKRQDGAATGDRDRRIEARSDWLAARRRSPVVR